MAEAVFEDDHIIAFWHAGSSDYLLVTFNDAVSTVAGDRFFSDMPARKNDIACLGIMSKRPDWFPRMSVAALREAADGRIAPYATRIGYGGSMGAYGAIKFSALFGLTHAIALCPQWSIDPDECTGHDPGFQQYWDRSMAGHGITASEVAGRILVFSDPHEPIDAYHAERLQEIHPATVLIPVPMVGHHVTPAFAGSANLRMLIEEARHGSVATIKRFVAPLRRASPIRAQNLLIAAARRHPRMGCRAAMSRPVALRNMPHGTTMFHMPVLRALLTQGLEREAAALAQTIHLSSRSQDETAAAELILAHHRALRFEAQTFLLGTIHGSWVAFDMDRSLLCHVPAQVCAENRARYRIAYLQRRADGTAGLFVRVNTTIVWLLLTETDEIRVALPSLLDPTAASGSLFETIGVTESVEPRFAVRGQRGFMSATADGQVIFNRTVVGGGWEWFVLAPPQDGLPPKLETIA